MGKISGFWNCVSWNNDDTFIGKNNKIRSGYCHTWHRITRDLRVFISPSRGTVG